MTPFEAPAVAARFQAYPPRARRVLLRLRELIFQVARDTPGVGGLQETLKWGEPAYLTRARAGSTVRMDWKPKAPDRVSLYFNCRTTLVESFSSMFPNDFEFDRRRAVHVGIQGRMPRDALAVCMAAALTYHLHKRGSPPGK